MDCEDPDCDEKADGTCDTGQPGICSSGIYTCSGGSKVCVQNNQPQKEGPSGNATCSDGLDNDCDGKTDSGDPDCAEVIYIEPNGICGDNAPCYSSIQEGINVAGDGVTIKVAQGVYKENLIVNPSKNFILEGGWSSNFTNRDNNPSLTIIEGDVNDDGSGDGTVISISTGSGEVDTVAIKGFTIRNGKRGIYAYAYSSGKINITLNSNIISDNGWISGSGGGIYARSSGSGSAITMRLINNMITNNTATKRGGGLYAVSESSGSTKVNLINNTITGNSSLYGGGLYLYSSNGNTRSTVKNNIIWGNKASYGKDIAIRQAGGVATVNSSYNDIKGIYNDPSYPGTYSNLGGNINLNPLFLEPSSGDYHLTSNSPCIDKGTDDGAPLTDIDGDPRPLDGNGDTIEITDIGADEFRWNPPALYVELSGDCGGETPCYTSIQKAIDDAGNGEQINVSQGIYYENILIPKSSDKPL
ncbi:MAG: choice-of-anchor Q domain-containing protein [Thermodesulfovibrionales bacterium]